MKRPVVRVTIIDESGVVLHSENSGNAYRFPATIVSLAEKSLRVSGDAGSDMAGRVVTLPRFFGAGYSAKNGVFPIESETTNAAMGWW